MRTHGIIVGVACAAMGMVAGASEFVIYDTLWIHDEEFMDAGVGHAIGGANGPLARVTDSQIVEDFDLTATATLTRAAADIMSYNGSVPSEGVWVQIYQDVDGKPSEISFADYFASPDDIEAEKIFSPLNFPAWRLHIDLSGADLRLNSGAWWIDFQPIDIETKGDWFWTIGSVSIPAEGFPSHVRDGWLAHGNSYYGLWGSTTWIPHNFRGNAVLSWRLEGAREDCTGREKLKAKCKTGGMLVAKLKRGRPGMELEFTLDGQDVRYARVNDAGRSKVKWSGVEPGSHVVTLSTCDIPVDVACR